MGPGEHGAAPSSSVRAERRVAHAVPPAALAAGALVLVGQGLLARASIRAFDDGSFGPAQRARGEHVRALGDGTVVLISFQVEPQIVETTHPELFEFVLLDVLEAQARAGVPPEQVADLFAAVVGPAVAAPATTVVLDRGYVAREAGHPATAPYFRAIEARAALLARVESRPLGERDYWLLRPLASPSDDAGVR